MLVTSHGLRIVRGLGAMRPRDDPDLRTAMLLYRLLTGAAMIAALVGVLIFDQRFAPWYPMWFLTVTMVMVAAAMEMTGLLKATGAHPSSSVVIGGVLALVAANWAPHVLSVTSLGTSSGLMHNAWSAEALAWPMWTFTAILMLSFLDVASRFRQGGHGATATIASTLFATAYVGLLGSFIIQFRWIEGHGDGLVALAMLIATAKGADTGAYVVGRIAGRNKLIPRLSPNKTVEGALGGLSASTLASVLGVAWSRAAGIPSFSWPAAIGFGLLVGFAAQVGDLMESMIKRDGDRKDASHVLPGFGGVLDVMDSLLFSGPIAFGYWLALGP